jgi:Pyruvate/2-oxoacid:ferredoxin oxidoreductase gamma subunit
MTGGQHSPTTPAGGLTATTPGGHVERPLDLCATVAAAGASWVYRGTNFDADLAARIAEAIRHPGFALLDIWEPCTAYYAPRNRLGKKAIYDLVASLGFKTGLVHQSDAPEYGAALRAAATKGKPGAASPGAVAPRPIEPRFQSNLDRTFRLVLAGAAGGKVGTAARLLSRAAVLANLYAAQRSDYPVTVKTGYSLAEIILSPEPIEDASIEAADALLLLASEGRKLAQGYARNLAPEGRFFILQGVSPLEGDTAAELLDPLTARVRPAKDFIATAAVAAVALRLGLIPLEALEAAADEDGESAAIRGALEAAVGMA